MQRGYKNYRKWINTTLIHPLDFRFVQKTTHISFWRWLSNLFGDILCRPRPSIALHNPSPNPPNAIIMIKINPTQIGNSVDSELLVHESDSWEGKPNIIMTWAGWGEGRPLMRLWRQLILYWGGAQLRGEYDLLTPDMNGKRTTEALQNEIEGHWITNVYNYRKCDDC